jgi:hypothetical protein
LDTPASRATSAIVAREAVNEAGTCDDEFLLDIGKLKTDSRKNETNFSQY